MKSVTVVYHPEQDGSWWADSPTLAGYTAVGETLSDTRDLAREGIPFFVDGDVEILEILESGAPVVISAVFVASWGHSAWAPAHVSGRPAMAG